MVCCTNNGRCGCSSCNNSCRGYGTVFGRIIGGVTGPTGPIGPTGEAGVVTPGVAVADLDPTADLATVITTVNDLLASLRDAGLIET